jgi:hypothetical protein
MNVMPSDVAGEGAFGLYRRLDWLGPAQKSTFGALSAELPVFAFPIVGHGADRAGRREQLAELPVDEYDCAREASCVSKLLELESGWRSVESPKLASNQLAGVFVACRCNSGCLQFLGGQ